LVLSQCIFTPLGVLFVTLKAESGGGGGWDFFKWVFGNNNIVVGFL